MKKLFGAIALSCAMVLPFFAGCGGRTETPDENKTDPLPPSYDVAAPAYTDADATLALSGKPTADSEISSDLFGLFLEDINYAGFALDDNLVANGSFESTGNRSDLWSGTNAAITIENKTPLFAEAGYSGYYAKLNVQAGGSLVNRDKNGTRGYKWVPMYIENGIDYLFSFFIKGYAGEVTVQAKTGSNVCLSDTFSVTESSDWVKYERTIMAQNSGRENVEFSLIFGSADSDVCVDAIKLETTDSTCGFKNYLYNAIKDLSPAFLRFPGGCVIEGTGETVVYDWKNSVGAIAKNGDDTVPGVSYTLIKDGAESTETTRGEQATRKPNGSLWKRTSYYDFEYGIGFYEFFELCDSLGAKAVPILNCGLSCQIQTKPAAVALSGRQGGGVQDFIQDALDLVAFAKGDPASSDEDEAYWAQLRVDMGHAEPYDMDYLGIGNEQWGEYYTQYYEKFLKAFKDAEEENPLYGTVKLIVGNGPNFQYDVQFGYNEETGSWARMGTANTAARNYIDRADRAVANVVDYGLVDHHYYMNYTDFLETVDMYDDYLRWDDDPEKYYEVFVGEYAANTNFTRSEYHLNNKMSSFDQTRNGWLVALSEAAFMTGLERNGDIVKLAAYAPMFGAYGVQVGDALQWETDMMYFTNEDVVLSSNYFVQQLFMKNSGNYLLNNTLSFAQGKSMPQTTYNGFAAYNDTAGDHVTAEPASRTFDDIYIVTSYDFDKETKDILVKIVNVGESEVKLNIDLKELSMKLTGVADLTVLQNDDKDAVSVLYENAVTPKKTTLGAFGSDVIGYTVPKYSVSALRIHTA